MNVSSVDVFWYGSLGGVIGYALAYLLPFGRGLFEGTVQLSQMSASRFVGLVAIAAMYIFLGGAAAVMFQANSAWFAVVAGIGFEGVFRSATTKLA